MDETERKQLIASIKAAIAEGVADTDAVKSIMGRLNQVEQLLSEKGNAPARIRGIANPFNDAFMQRVKAVAEDGALSTGRIALPGVSLSRVKSVLTTGSGGNENSPDNSYPVNAQRLTDVGPLSAPISVLNAFSHRRVSTHQVEYVRIERTSNAAVVAESAQKPETSFETNLVTARCPTIAHWSQATRQLLSDQPQLQSFISRVLAVDVVRKAEALVVNGNGTTDEIEGLATAATAFAHTASPPVDRISEAAMAMYLQGHVADRIIVSPSDWHDIRVERATSGDNQYISAGWSNPSPPSVWSLPCVLSPDLAAGTALVVDSRFVEILDRGDVQTLISTEDRDNFVKNIITILCEGSLGLAIYKSTAVLAVDLAST